LREAVFYFNTYGDYIIEVTLDPKTQKSIDDFYKSYSVWDDHAKARLNFKITAVLAKSPFWNPQAKATALPSNSSQGLGRLLG
jgi:hypothetical protein